MADYSVRLLINVAADDPQEAVRAFIDELLIQGLANLTYNVQDRDTDTIYIATIEEFAEASVLKAQLDDPDYGEEPLLGDPGTVEDAERLADLRWNGKPIETVELSDEGEDEGDEVNDLKLPVKGICKRCGDLAEVDPSTGLCPQCEQDIEGVPA